MKAPGIHEKEYHIYGFEWSPTFLKFYLDGKLVEGADNYLRRRYG